MMRPIRLGTIVGITRDGEDVAAELVDVIERVPVFAVLGVGSPPGASHRHAPCCYCETGNLMVAKHEGACRRPFVYPCCGVEGDWEAMA